MERRAATRQTDEARERAAAALHDAWRTQDSKPWEKASEATQNRFRGYIDITQLFDSRVDTWNHIHRVRSLIDHAVLKLIRRGQQHDQTKLASPEREAFDLATPKLRDTQYGSAAYRQTLSEMEGALAHHYEHNSHHPEHFQNGIKGMSLLDLVEMMCDWKAAGERHADGGDIMRSIEMNASRFGISTQLRTILENTAQEMGWVQTFLQQATARVQDGRPFTAEEVVRLQDEEGVIGVDTYPGRAVSGETVYYVQKIRMSMSTTVSERDAA